MSAREFCTVTASTKRTADLGSGRSGNATENLASLLITPLWPLGRQTIQQFAINSPREFKECFHVPVDGGSLPDVREGDMLVVSSVEYPIDYVAEWTDGDIPCLHIVCQEVKGT